MCCVFCRVLEMALADDICLQEAAWTGTKEDETAIIFQLSDEILEDLLKDTVDCLERGHGGRKV